MHTKATAWIELKCGCEIQCDLALDDNEWYIDNAFLHECDKHKDKFDNWIDLPWLAGWLIREHAGLTLTEFAEEEVVRIDLGLDEAWSLYSAEE